MIFNSWVFGLFALVVFCLYYVAIPRSGKRIYLIAVGAVFYAYAVPAYLILISMLGAATYGFGQAMLGMPHRQRGLLLAFGVGLSVGILVFFKYTRFLGSIVDEVSRRHIVPIPDVIVPLAISFFTFEFVHVLVDIYFDRITSLDPIDFAVFTMFFPTLVAGPIKRYQSFAPQLRAITAPATSEIALNLYRVVLGIAKKAILADSMNAFTAPIMSPNDALGRPDYVVAVLAYTAKIYFDFSGYSDIAIGLAGLLGLRIPENFDRPYQSRNISEFWRRWHISLSSWIRDYVFIPLGGSRRGALVTAVNLFLAMTLAGLWHGAAWTFALWGLWHGAGLVSHRMWTMSVVPRFQLLRTGSSSVRLASVATTFGFVSCGWILFAAPSLPMATLVFRRVFF